MEKSTTKTGSSPVAYLADIPASKSVIYPPHLRGHFEGGPSAVLAMPSV